MPDDLYDCYLLFMQASKKAILRALSTKKEKDLFLRMPTPVSRRAFNLALATMKPKQRREFEKEFRTPYPQRMEEGMRAVEQALHEYKTNPEVRARVAKEVEAALAKGLTPAKRKR